MNPFLIIISKYNNEIIKSFSEYDINFEQSCLGYSPEELADIYWNSDTAILIGEILKDKSDKNIEEIHDDL